MGTYVAKTALSLPIDPTRKTLRTRVYRPGEVVELDDQDVIDSLLERGGIREQDSKAPAQADDEAFPLPRELPERPSNGAPKDTWVAYLKALEAATQELGPLDVPADAKRDDMIQIGDARVAEWNEE